VLGEDDRFLLYGTAGLALAGVEGLSGTFTPSGLNWCDGGCFFGKSDDETQVGFAIGAGGEWAVSDTVSVGAEYLFLGFDEDDGPSLTFFGDDGREFTIQRGVDDLSIFRLKLNLRFPPH
jgi:opacity protein-like surface antigen